MSKKTKEGFEQLKSESPKAYAAARIYFKLGPERSIEKVVQELGKSGALLERWASQYGWVRRARAYDAWLSETEDREAERLEAEQANTWVERRAATREEAYRVARDLINKGKEMLLFPLAEQEKKVSKDGKTTIIIKPVGWRMRDAATFFKVANELGRLACEMETIIQKNIEEIDYEQAIEAHIDAMRLEGIELTRAEAIADLAKFLPALRNKYAVAVETE